MSPQRIQEIRTRFLEKPCPPVFREVIEELLLEVDPKPARKKAQPDDQE